MTNMTYRRPLIGIAPSHNDDRPTVSMRYLDSIWRAGGVGVILSYTEDPEKLAEYAELFDGFLFSGGVDVNPTRYGEEKQFDSVEIDDWRDNFEAGLFAAVYPTRKPLLGICRGIQSINVFLGGTLHQHIDGHTQTVLPPAHEQRITLVPDTLLARLSGGKDAIYVNSYHHQAVKDVAPALVVNALSDDGYIEAVHAPEHPFLLGVQFHPEIYNACEDDDHSRAIFEAFVAACRV